MPTNLPRRDPFRALNVHATRRDRNTVAALLLTCALLTLGAAFVSPRTTLNAMARGVATAWGRETNGL